jgi:hypothetical protein
MKTKLDLLMAGILLAGLGTGLAQPIITNQPYTQATAPGATATFQVGATGTAPLAYQWQQNPGTGFSDLADRTNAALVLTNVQPWDACDYRVVITNITGARTSAVARLHVMRFSPVSTSIFSDNFDDNTLTGWFLIHTSGGTGWIKETNGQFTAYGSWPGVQTIYPWDTLAEGGGGVNWGMADGQTVEFRADLVALSEDATNSTMMEVAQDYGHTYIFLKGRDFIKIAKWRSDLGSATFWYEKAPIRNTNIVVAIALTRAGPNVVLTARVLDKENPSVVLYQHSVVDTPGADPTVSMPDISIITVPDAPGAPYTSGIGGTLGLWQYTNGHQPPAQATYDNFEIRKYDAVFTRYVDVNSTNPTPPYTNWLTAAINIQDAVDVALAGDEVVVTDGIYATGGRAVGTNVLVNRVAVDKPLTLRSVIGPQSTVIQGYQLPVTTNGNGAIRCVYLANGVNLSGFTLTNGATRVVDEYHALGESGGGGVWSESPTAVVSNCVVVGNSAWSGGGGAHRGTLNNCTLTGNSGGYQGGGAYGGTLKNCWLAGNSARNGGGVIASTLNNCTLTGNSASKVGGGASGGSWLNNCTLTGNSADSGGGVYFASLNNCIVYFNSAPNGPNYAADRISLNYCCTTPMPTNGVGNITNEPLFVDYAGGNLRLQANSPCINAGFNAHAPGPTDLDGLPRIVRGTVDMGAYEYQGSGSLISYAWLQHYGLPTDGSADAMDPDADGHTTWEEWRCLTDPTNALSALRLLSAWPTDSNVTVSWQSVAGVDYFLERSTNLWASPPFTLLAPNLPGQPDTTSFTDTNAAALAPLFYRVGVGQ